MEKEKKDMLNKEDQEKEAAYLLAAELIRKRSEAGKFAFPEEVFQALSGRNHTTSNNDPLPEEAVNKVITETFMRNEDLKEVTGSDGLPRYYSAVFMSDAYVKLLLRKEGDPFLLIADTVRENSKVYPRPIPLDTFKHPPFELNEEEISTCLQKMEKEGEYKDIARTTTSAGTVFLYSTLHLDQDYASMLAEWVDVGQYKNP